MLNRFSSTSVIDLKRLRPSATTWTSTLSIPLSRFEGIMCSMAKGPRRRKGLLRSFRYILLQTPAIASALRSCKSGAKDWLLRTNGLRGTNRPFIVGVYRCYPSALSSANFGVSLMGRRWSPSGALKGRAKGLLIPVSSSVTQNSQSFNLLRQSTAREIIPSIVDHISQAFVAYWGYHIDSHVGRKM